MWQADVPHGDLAAARGAFEAYVELLTRGDTRRLEGPPELAARGTETDAVSPAPLTSSRPSRDMRRTEPPAEQRDIFTALPERPPPSAGPRLAIAVVNGNLKFVRPPLMLGHYRASKLTGSEAEMDRLLDGTMSASLRAGLYPSTPGSHQVFLNTGANPDDPYALPRPEAVVVVGLGEEGTLRATDLMLTVRQAAIAYTQRLSEAHAPTTFEVAATLIGSGGISVEIGTAAQAITRGVSQANDRLASAGWPVVAKLDLIELYLDRATEAYRALAALASDYPQSYRLGAQVDRGRGALSRPVDAGYRGAGYDFISVQRRGDGGAGVIEFTLDTRRARDEVRGQATQPKLIDELVCAGANDRNRNQQIGRSLFKLLVPIELEPFLSGSSSVLLQLDKPTAYYPWELLDTQHDETDPLDDPRPWAVRTRMLRKLDGLHRVCISDNLSYDEPCAPAGSLGATRP